MYILGIKPGFFCYSRGGKTLPMCNHRYWGSQHPFSTTFLYRVVILPRFSSGVHWRYQVSTGRKKKKKEFGLWAYLLDLMVRDWGFFNVYAFDSHLYRWLQFFNTNLIPFSSGSNTPRKKVSITEVLGYVIFANPGSILCHCTRDVKRQWTGFEYRCWYDYRDVYCLKS